MEVTSFYNTFMKAFWNSFPFFRFLVPFIAGIIFASEYSLPQHCFKLTLYIIIAFLIGLSLLFYLLNNKLRALINHRNNFIFGILLNLVVFLSGIFLTLVNIDRYKPYNISNFTKFDYSYIVKLTEEPVINNSNLKILTRVIKAKSDSQYIKAQGNIIIYLKKDTFSSRLKYGDILYVHPVLK
ncbi:MAG: DUF4131 domain-containing protein, partial [Bacteroidales bacterium]|nr:DUF4131 domain-containing protein [Bacteroidales bacterium]